MENIFCFEVDVPPLKLTNLIPRMIRHKVENGVVYAFQEFSFKENPLFGEPLVATLEQRKNGEIFFEIRYYTGRDEVYFFNDAKGNFFFDVEDEYNDRRRIKSRAADMRITYTLSRRRVKTALEYLGLRPKELHQIFSGLKNSLYIKWRASK